jgi:hypothetical protein
LGTATNQTEQKAREEKERKKERKKEGKREGKRNQPLDAMLAEVDFATLTL